VKQGDLFADAGDAKPAPGAKPRKGGREPKGTPKRSPSGTAAPVDAADRLRAVTTFDRPVLLEAGAGTGKTATLVARVLSWCLGPGWERHAQPPAEPEEIGVRVLSGVVAITFTEAAAAEMAARIGKALARVQREPDRLPLGLALELLPGPQELFGRARALRAALDHLNVGTIHAFCRRLLAAHPLEVGIAPDFEVDAAGSRTNVLVREVLEGFLREAWAEPVDARLLALAHRRIAPPEIEAAVLALLDQGARAADFAVDPLDGVTAERLLAETLEALRAVSSLGAARLSSAKRSPNSILAVEAIQDCELALRGLREEEHSNESRAFLERLCELVRGSWSKKARSRLDDWGRKHDLNGTETAALGDDGPEFLRRADALLQKIELLNALEPSFLDAARRVLHEVLRRIEAELRRRGVLTFNDLLCEARRLLVEHEGVARRERGRIEQLLVDEFQDTDELQCDVVRALGLPEDGEGPCLFLVGDPKQSIFAWRNADLAAYDAFKARVQRAGGLVLSLEQNFRSVPEILEEVERCVRPAMEEVPGVQPAFAPLHPHRPSAGGGPAVEHWVSWSRDPAGGALVADGAKSATYQVEARALARDVRLRHDREGVPWKHFGLIFRALTEIEPYLGELRELDVPYEVQSDRKYYQRREVIDATALVRAVLDPNDLLALITLLRSPMVGLPDAALLPLWEERFPALVARLDRPDEKKLAELADLVRRSGARVPASIPGIDGIRGWEESVIGALESLALARRSFREDPVDRWVERLRALFLPDATEAARFLGAYRLANLERFFRELLRTLEERRGDVQSILRTLRANLGRDDKTEASRPSDSDQDAVQVLTIHGAKGLEFPHVYLAQVHKDERRGGNDDTLFERRAGLVSYRLFASPAPGFFAAEALRAEAEKAERVRLLYVALTRARDHLVVLGNLGRSGKPKDWRSARNFADLLESREGSQEALLSLAASAGEDDPPPTVDPFGARWSLAALRAGTGQDGGAERATQVFPLERARSDAELLASLRTAALQREARPFQSRASETHGDSRERSFGRAERAEARFEEESGVRLGRAAALAVGTLVHRRLELGTALDAGSLAAELEVVLPEADDAERAAALERVRDLFERMQRNGILARLDALDVVARELPVLAPPAADDTDAGPVGFVAGAIDLFYRDSAGELVVADYKTDLVEDEHELEVRAARYAGQGRVYARAVRGALGLASDPPFELWFLHAGRVIRS